MPDQSIVVLNDDQKAIAMKATKELIHGASFIHEMVKGGKLTIEMRNTMCGLLDHYTKEICEPLGYSSEAAQRIEENHAEIRKLNGKIHKLEHQLGEAAPIDTVPNLLRNLFDDVSDWWKNKGMGWIHELNYGPYGNVNLHFSFAFDHIFTGSKTPVSDKKSNDDNIASLKEQGFIFVVDERDHRLLDCDKNRELLMRLLTTRFPSIQIEFWKNRSVYQSDKFALWGIEATIRNIHDLAAKAKNEE